MSLLFNPVVFIFEHTHKRILYNILVLFINYLTDDFS